MANCFDYLTEYGNITFEESGINEIDGALLARFSYIPFELIGSTSAITIEQAYRSITDAMVIREAVDSRDYHIFELMSKSRRFCNALIIEYESIRDEESETQFSAVTLRLSDGKYFVVFRGTDDSLVGWKEDFNMSFSTPVPSQELAVRYFERVASRVRGEFALGGHSKGGNLAVYAAAFCRAELQSRIEAVINYDGPGFDESVIATDGYQAVKGRTITFLPQTSVIGMLLNHEEEYVVVRSGRAGLLQHDIYTWQVSGDCFERVCDVTNASRFIDRTLKESIGSLSPEKRERLVDMLHSVLSQTGAKTLSDLRHNWVRNSIAIMRVASFMDMETGKLLLDLLMALGKGAGIAMFERFSTDN